MTDKRTFNHGDRESRRRKACERLGTDSPNCLLCEERFPQALELHHPAQRQFLEHTVVICQNHHTRLSDMMKDHPAKIAGCTNQLENFGHLALGHGDMLEVAADELRDPGLANFLMYLRWQWKELGLLLIEMARRNPGQDMEVAP